MNDIRRYIIILENASQDELQKYRDEQKYWQNAHKKYWSISKKLMAQYRDGSHTEKDRDGNLIWKKDGKLHRDGDKPAWISSDGTLAWVKNDQYHRDGDLPAYIGADGRLGWYQNGEMHRDNDKPAWIGADGGLQWYQNGEAHRDGDKPQYIGADGYLRWCQNAQNHRFSGPAIMSPGGKLEWWWRGEKIPVNSQEEFIEWMKKHKGMQRFKINKS